jgi:hypothetical protein
MRAFDLLRLSYPLSRVEGERVGFTHWAEVSDRKERAYEAISG